MRDWPSGHMPATVWPVVNMPFLHVKFVSYRFAWQKKEHQPTNKKVLRPTMKQLSLRRLPTVMPGLLHGDASLVAPRRQDGRLVHEILEICSAEASRALGDVQKRHLRQRAAARIQILSCIT